jgi:hypothetical protein
MRSKPVGGDGRDRGENYSSPSPPSEAKQRPTAYDRTPAWVRQSLISLQLSTLQV